MNVVVRDGIEIEWFENEKAAAAFVAHVYGLSIYDLIEQTSIEIRGVEGRGPRPGDVVRLPEGDAILGHDGFATLNARTFRADGRVSCSGGPCPPAGGLSEAPVGLARVRVWRWADGYPAAHNDGEYYVTVPAWAPLTKG